jgi:amino acid permease
LDALAEGRDLVNPPTIQDLERHATEWAGLVPANSSLQAALARLIGSKYRFTPAVTPDLCRALNLDDSSVQQAFERKFGRPFSSIFAKQLTRRERLRWVRAALAGRLENLPPFWTAYALTLTETVGASVLALPIALARVGPIAGIVLLVVLGLVNVITIAGMSEAFARDGNVRFGRAYLGRVVTDYLGSAGAVVLTPFLLMLTVLALMIFYLGISTTIAGATLIPAPVWAALLFAVQIYFLRRESLNATIASAMAIGLINIALLIALSMLALPHLANANLALVNVPLLNGQPFDPAVLSLVFGVILSGYFGHLSTGSCAALVLRRDPSGRALLRGNIAAMASATALYVLWTIAVNGAIPAATLAGESGTALTPLAAIAGPWVSVLGSLFASLGMGMGSIHMALALFNQVREWLRPPTQMPRAASREWRSWVALAPIAAIFLVVEEQLITSQGSFAGLFWTLALVIPVLAGVFPVLMLAASRRRGDCALNTAIGWMGHPVVLISVLLLYLIGVLAHGLVIWQDPLQRVVALVVGVVMIGLAAIVVRGGALVKRVVVELRVERGVETRTVLGVVSAGKLLPCMIGFGDGTGRPESQTSRGESFSMAPVTTATVDLSQSSAREIKVWTHEITPEGLDRELPARVVIRDGLTMQPKDVAAIPYHGEPCGIEINLASA